MECYIICCIFTDLGIATNSDDQNNNRKPDHIHYPSEEILFIHLYVYIVVSVPLCLEDISNQAKNWCGGGSTRTQLLYFSCTFFMFSFYVNPLTAGRRITFEQAQEKKSVVACCYSSNITSFLDWPHSKKRLSKSKSFGLNRDAWVSFSIG